MKWRRRRRRPVPGLPERTTTWIDGGSGVTWRPNGFLDYGRFYSYVDSFGDEVVLPTGLVAAIRGV